MRHLDIIHVPETGALSSPYLFQNSVACFDSWSSPQLWTWYAMICSPDMESGWQTLCQLQVPHPCTLTEVHLRYLSYSCLHAHSFSVWFAFQWSKTWAKNMAHFQLLVCSRLTAHIIWAAQLQCHLSLLAHKFLALTWTLTKSNLHLLKSYLMFTCDHSKHNTLLWSCMMCHARSELEFMIRLQNLVTVLLAVVLWNNPPALCQLDSIPFWSPWMKLILHKIILHINIACSFTICPLVYDVFLSLFNDMFWLFVLVMS